MGRMTPQHVALLNAAQRFISKCETGRAKSRESYSEFKAAVALTNGGRAKYVTTARAAELVGGISTSTIYRAIKAGKVKTFRTPGGHYRVALAEVEAFARSLESAT